jgi:hypothetical protein
MRQQRWHFPPSAGRGDADPRHVFEAERVRQRLADIIR